MKFLLPQPLEQKMVAYVLLIPKANGVYVPHCVVLLEEERRVSSEEQIGESVVIVLTSFTPGLNIAL